MSRRDRIEKAGSNAFGLVASSAMFVLLAGFFHGLPGSFLTLAGLPSLLIAIVSLSVVGLIARRCAIELFWPNPGSAERARRKRIGNRLTFVVTVFACLSFMAVAGLQIHHAFYGMHPNRRTVKDWLLPIALFGFFVWILVQLVLSIGRRARGELPEDDDEAD